MNFSQSQLSNIAEEFWLITGQKYHPPYDIIGAVALSLPIDIVCLSELSVRGVQDWLLKKGINISININDRDLHGFILTSRGSALIFVNGSDSEDERRFTVAHEVSHFLLDYNIPRSRILDKLGTQVKDVVDGIREPTLLEQVNGIINGLSVEPFTHLLEKYGDGSFEQVKIFQSENNADFLALELLAPRQKVVAQVLRSNSKPSFDVFREKVHKVLVKKYGLPDSIAQDYAVSLSYSITGGKTIIDKLGL